MDEIFHLPQTVAYCEGRFTHWDPKITTFPGLYLVTLAYEAVLTKFSAPANWHGCTLSLTRSVNIIFAALSSLVFYRLSFIHNGQLYATRKNGNLLAALTSYLLPISFFFHFMYYTDSGSTFFVLAAYYYALSGRQIFSALLSSCAVLFRQTNIVWVVFMLAVSIFQHDYLARRKDTPNGVIPELTSFVVFVLRNVFGLIFKHFGHVLVILGFVVFVVQNGSITVGDKEAHTAIIHVPQFYYFLATATLFLFTTTLSFGAMKEFIKKHTVGLTINQLAVTLTVLAAMSWTVHKFTYAHPYLLADNRHYTFYIWRRLFMAYDPYFKFAMVPIYYYSLWTLWHAMRVRSAVWKLMFFICCFVVLVPSPLFEFRYYIVPIQLLMLHTTDYTKTQAILLNYLAFIAINVVTFYLYLFKPFYWPNNEVARFMW
jgi:alpha-1,2-glucosyltransferase